MDISGTKRDWPFNKGGRCYEIWFLRYFRHLIVHYRNIRMIIKSVSKEIENTLFNTIGLPSSHHVFCQKSKGFLIVCVL
jgi:hypothetical protein